MHLYQRLDSKLVEKTIRLEKHIEHLEDHILEMRRSLEALSKSLERLREEVEAIRADLGYEARRRVEEVLSSRFPGIEVRSLSLSTGVSFDIFSRIGDTVVIGRAYTVASVHEYESLLADLERMEMLEPSLSAPNKVIVIYTLRPLRDLVEVASRDEKLLVVTPTRTYGHLA